jgi:hypothetical protein
MRQADSGKFPLLLQMPDESPKVAKTNQAKIRSKMACQWQPNAACTLELLLCENRGVKSRRRL